MTARSERASHAELSPEPPFLQRILLFSPVLLTFGLSLWASNVRQLWRDELATYWAASISREGLMRLLSHVDVVMAPYYIIMHGWIRLFGDSARSLRLPSALAMSLATWLVIQLGRELGNVRVGIVAGMLFAIIPSSSAFGQEARAYAFAVAACVLATLLLLRALAHPSRGRWAAYGLTVTLMGSCHLVSLLALLGHACAVLDANAQDRPAQRRAWLLATAGGLAAVLPVILLGASQRQQVAWIESASLLKRMGDLPMRLFDSTLIAGAVASLALSGLACPHRQRRLLAAWALLPPLVLALVDSRLHLLLHRYLLFIVPAWVLLASLALDELSKRSRLSSLAPLSLCVFLAAFSVGDQRRLRGTIRHRDSDYRAAAQIVREQARPGDAIAFSGRSSMMRIAFSYYFKRSAGELPADIFVRRSAEASGSFAPLERRAAKAVLRGVQRLWLVATAAPSNLFRGQPRARARVLERRFDVASVWKVPHATVALLTAKRKVTREALSHRAEGG